MEVIIEASYNLCPVPLDEITPSGLELVRSVSLECDAVWARR